MPLHKVLFHPLDQMVFKGSFNQLVKKVRREKLMDISTWKVIGKWLK